MGDTNRPSRSRSGNRTSIIIGNSATVLKVFRRTPGGICSHEFVKRDVSVRDIVSNSSERDRRRAITLLRDNVAGMVKVMILRIDVHGDPLAVMTWMLQVKYR